MDKLHQHVSDKVKAITRIPNIQSVSLSPRGTLSSSFHVVARYTQTSVETSESVEYERHFSVRDESVLYEGMAQKVLPKSQVCYSPSLTKKALFRQKQPDKDSNYYLDIWSANCLQFTVDLDAAKKHGPPYLAGSLASFDWNRDETRFLYMAERRRVPAASFFDPWSPTEAVRGSESNYYEDWGEQMCGQHQSVVVLLDVTSGVFTIIDSPESRCLGQARWLGAEAIYAIAFDAFPKRLGLIYCTTRPSNVVKFLVDKDGDTMETITSSSPIPQSCRSLRFSPDERFLVWLQTDAGGPHHKGAKLVCLNNITKEQTVLVDIVESPSSINTFCGIYCMSLPEQCFLTSHEVCFSTQQGSMLASHVVDVVSGQRCKFGGSDFQILAADSGVVIGVVSSLLRPHQLMVKIRTACGEWTDVLLGESLDSFPGNIQHLEFSRETYPEELATIPYTGILVKPSPPSSTGTQALPVPLIVFPHGGPHGGMVDAWSQHVSLFVSLGCAVLLVNYRGSIGAGEKSLHALLGRVGRLDVDDCVHAVKHTLSVQHGNQQQSVCLDGARVGAYGGSHGGFLVTQMSGQLPDMVRAVVARNPVCDIAGMLDATDIPDWCLVEACGTIGHTHGFVPSSEQLGRMFEQSPLSHVSKVRAPTLLLVGTADRRVVPSQAFSYHHALLAAGVVSEARVYDDCHSLSKPGVNADVMVHSSVWLCRHLKHEPLVEHV